MSGGHHDDYHVEPVPGLPENLPAGEHILWQGAPRWWDLAQRVFHIRAAAAYLLLLVLVRSWMRLQDGGPHAALLSLLSLLPLVLAGLGLLALLAWLSGRTTLYTLTNRRVVFRIGIALPMAINIPFSAIAAAGVRQGGDGTGDILLTLTEGNRIAYSNLWPHVRPWRFKAPEPLLRTIGDARSVADLLAAALRGEAPPLSRSVNVPLPDPAAKPRAISWRNVQIS
jgi:hypothetical protein